MSKFIPATIITIHLMVGRSNQSLCVNIQPKFHLVDKRANDLARPQFQL